MLPRAGSRSQPVGGIDDLAEQGPHFSAEECINSEPQLVRLKRNLPEGEPRQGRLPMNEPHHIAESSLVKLLKATLVGGLLFLLPLMLIAVLLGHAMRVAGAVARPVSDFLTVDTIIGPGGEKLLAVLMIVCISI